MRQLLTFRNNNTPCHLNPPEVKTNHHKEHQGDHPGVKVKKVGQGNAAYFRPPKKCLLSNLSNKGMYCNWLVTKVTAKYESWPYGSKYPVKFDKTTSRSKVIRIYLT